MTEPVEARRGLRTAVLVKQVPAEGGDGDLGADGRLRRSDLDAEMNPWCRRAVAQTVRLASPPGGRSTAVTLGPPRAADVLREAMACGVDDAVHLCDPRWAGADCLTTAKALAAAVGSLGEVDLILVGHSSVDGNTTAVGSLVAELLDLPFAGAALDIVVRDAGDARVLHTTVQSEEGGSRVQVRLPAVVAVAERSCEPAKATADTWPDVDRIRTLTAADLAGLPGVTHAEFDGSGPVQSPTSVAGVRIQPPAGRYPVLLRGSLDKQAETALDLWQARLAEGRRPTGGKAEEGLRPVPPRGRGGPLTRILVLTGQPGGSEAQILLGEAAVLAGRFGARVVAVVHPGADTGPFGSWGADELIMLGGDAPRPAAAALASWFAVHGRPLAVLGSARSWDREVLGRLAVRYDSGLLTDLTRLEVQVRGPGDFTLTGIKPAGQSTLAEVVNRGPLQVATLRTGYLDLRTPRTGGGLLPVWNVAVPADPAVRRGPYRPDGDYDALERAENVIGIGLGVDPGRYAELEPLRRLLNAELAATRKVTDRGHLPHSRQLGITARSIAPHLYIALGVSGSSRHMNGVERAGTVLAVNSDPGALVFGRCDIGIVADWGDAVRALASALKRRSAPAAAASAI